MRSTQTDEFMFRLIEFMANLHDCHNCYHSQTLIYSKSRSIFAVTDLNMGKGKKRTICTKYGQPINKVRWDCIDRYLGLIPKEQYNIKKQHKAGNCMLVLEGVAI